MSGSASLRALGWICTVVAAAVISVWAYRIHEARSMPDLDFHHGAAGAGLEFRVRDHGSGLEWADYLALEDALVAKVRAIATEGGSGEDPVSRYNAESPMSPWSWGTDWNRSFELEPAERRGAIVMLHGASDSPYSVRSLAKRFHTAGLRVVAPRLPGNGTFPGELKTVRTADWIAVTRIAARHAARDLTSDEPLYFLGYSTGAALALDYALAASADESVRQATGIIFVSPAIAVTPFATIARWDLLISRLPGFDKFAWMNVHPEYEPFKYTSFPKQAGWIVYELAQRNAAALEKARASDTLAKLPPVLGFQSIVDATVSTSAVFELFERLESPGNRLVAFDVNQQANGLGFLRDGLPSLPDWFRNPPSGTTTLVTNADATSQNVVATHFCSSPMCAPPTPLTATWPATVFSLSHVALPFPPDDPLYGEDALLGAVNPRGERGVLLIPEANLMRLRHNPFFEYLAQEAIEFCEVCEQSLGDAIESTN